jgi:hypothetical protein
MIDLVGENNMSRYLICPPCLKEGEECYFSEVGPGFEPLETNERCRSMKPRNQATRHPLDEKHNGLVTSSGGPSALTLHAFLKDGIRDMHKQPFKELEDSLQVGDQVWIYRGRSTTRCNPVVCMCNMRYAHVVVVIGDGKVVHVGPKSGCCKGIMKGTIKMESIHDVIKQEDQGRSNQDNIFGL